MCDENRNCYTIHRSRDIGVGTPSITRRYFSKEAAKKAGNQWLQTNEQSGTVGTKTGCIYCCVPYYEPWLYVAERVPSPIKFGSVSAARNHDLANVADLFDGFRPSHVPNVSHMAR